MEQKFSGRYQKSVDHMLGIIDITLKRGMFQENHNTIGTLVPIDKH